MIFRKHFDYDVEAASSEAVVVQDPVSLTIQEMADDADINVIMRRFGLTGTIPQTLRLPTYDDFTGISDFQSALNAIIDATEQFNSIPPDIRARFDNNPQKFLEFVSDPKNRKEMFKLGLMKGIWEDTPEGKLEAEKLEKEAAELRNRSTAPVVT